MKRHSLLLLGLSGVRVQDGELLERGLHLPGFVERSQVIASLPHLGLLTLAAYTPENWEVEYREMDQVTDGIDRGSYDLVAISALTARIRTAYRLAEEYRETGAKVVIGGLHATALPDEAGQFADAVVIGDGEPVWGRLLRDFESGQLKPVYRESGFDLAASRVPRYDLLDVDRYNRIPVQASRGCPLDCNFCAASRLLGPYRKKPIARLRREIEEILRIWPRPFIELADDNTFIDRRWSKDLLRMLAEYPIKWFTETDLRVADDPELLHLLAQSNCAQVLIGLESPTADDLASIEPSGTKARLMDHVATRIERIQAAGVSVNGCFVLGLDSHSPEVFDQVLEATEAWRLSEVQITLLTPFPGTRLRAQLAGEGRLLPNQDWSAYTLFDVTYQPSQMTAEELRAGFLDLMGRIYSQDQVDQRKSIFRNCTAARRVARD